MNRLKTIKLERWNRRGTLNVELTSPWSLVQSRMIPAHPGDDWNPCFPGNLVEVSLHVWLSDLSSRVVVRGADDTVVERDQGLSEGLDLFLMITQGTCPAYYELLSPGWSFVGA